MNMSSCFIYQIVPYFMQNLSTYILLKYLYDVITIAYPSVHIV
jgi:hypothetical protein